MTTSVRRLKPRSFRSLAEIPPEPDWLWEKMLGPGQLTMLAGRSFGGKSTLVMALLGALAEGEPFLGLHTKEATALLLTEQNPYVLRSQAARFGCDTTSHQFVTAADGLLKCSWPEAIEEATEHAVDAGHQLLVIDSFATLAGLGPELENDAAAVTEHLRPLQEAASYELAVLFLHHTGHNGRTRGSTAFSAVVDIATRLQRAPNENRITLKTESRFPTPAEIKATIDDRQERSSYHTDTRNTTPAATRDADELIIKRVQADDAGAGLTAETIADTDGLTTDMVKKRLKSARRLAVAPARRFEVAPPVVGFAVL